MSEMDSLLKNLEANMSLGPGIFAQTIAQTDKDEKKPGTEGENRYQVGIVPTDEKTGTTDLVSAAEDPDKPIPRYKRGLSREDMLNLLKMLETHKPPARKVSQLAHKIVKELEEKEKNGGSDQKDQKAIVGSSKASASSSVTVESSSKKENKQLDSKKDNMQSRIQAMRAERERQQKELEQFRPEIGFVEAAQRIKELNLPEDPFEKFDMSEQRFQVNLEKFQFDQEIMELAGKVIPMMHNPEKTAEDLDEESDDTRPRKSLSLNEVCKVHEAMIAILSQILKMFQELPREVRHTFSAKTCETTAELLVSIGVEKRFKCISDDVEAALVKYENQLSRRQEFAACSQMLTQIMHQLTGSSKPRFNREEFIEYLEGMASTAGKFKKFTQELHEKQKKGEKNLVELYAEFERFAEINMSEAAGSGEMLPPTEMREHYESYREVEGEEEEKKAITKGEDSVDSNGTKETTDTTNESQTVGALTEGAATEDKENKKEESESTSTTTTLETSSKKKSTTKSCPLIQKLWEASGAEVQTIMQIASLANPMMSQMAAQGGPGGMGPGGGGPPGGMNMMSPMPMQMPKIQATGSKKLQKLKASDVVDMQELMVQELKKHAENFKDSMQEMTSNGEMGQLRYPGSEEQVIVKDQILVGFMQSLGHAAIDKRYGISSEEMAVAGFIHAASLSHNERFMQSTIEQQQVIMGMVGAGGGGGPGGPEGCSVM